MKYLKKANSNKFENNLMTFYEYPLGDKDLDCSVVELKNRYPEFGWTLNKKCKELFYVINGSGTLTTENEKISLTEGDMVIINPQEKYFWEGQLTLLTPCSPAWSSEQTENIK